MVYAFAWAFRREVEVRHFLCFVLRESLKF
jgi:hypothetical protein